MGEPRASSAMGFPKHGGCEHRGESSDEPLWDHGQFGRKLED